MKKQIDVVVKYFYPVAAGIETNILETYSVLVNKGWDVTVHTSNLDYTTGEILSEKSEIKGIKVRRYPLTWPCFMPSLPYRESTLICLHNFDILPHFFILITALIHKITNKKSYKLVLTPHGGFNPEWRVFSKIEAVVKSLYHFSLGVLLINWTVDSVRAVSEWEKNEMVKKGIYDKKIIVISNGVEDEAFLNIDENASDEIKKKVEDFGKYFIQVGRIYPIKNYETTITALASVPSDVKYVIVGPISDRNYLNKLKILAERLGVSERVIFAGVIRGIDKYYVIKHAKVMVHMALWESFCNVIHEAMSQGLPIIAANNTALSFLVKNNENGFLIETKDNNSVSEKLNLIFEPSNSQIIEKISQNNLQFAKDNTWSKTAERMDELYSSLCVRNQ